MVTTVGCSSRSPHGKTMEAISMHHEQTTQHLISRRQSPRRLSMGRVGKHGVVLTLAALRQRTRLATTLRSLKRLMTSRGTTSHSRSALLALRSHLSRALEQTSHARSIRDTATLVARRARTASPTLPP